jgi:hypothetical protein
VALILFGQLTEKGITEDREEYYSISFDYFLYPIEAQFPTVEVSLMVDLFSKLQHVTGDARKRRQFLLSGSIGHMAKCFPPVTIGHMVEPVSPTLLDAPLKRPLFTLLDAPLKRPLFQNTTTIDDKSKQECVI